MPDGNTNIRSGPLAADVLFRPLKLGPLEIRNRIVVAPMTRVSGTAEGEATPRMAAYYADFAKGGFGLVISEGIYPDAAHSQGYRNQPGLATATQQASWRPVTKAVHAAGGRIFAQLMHAGAQGQDNRFTNETVGPSAVAPKGEKSTRYGDGGPYAVPTALSVAEIDAIVEGFAAAAVRADEAGFDGIEIHGANGYLIDQFLSAYFNRRTDEYGGSPENRARFAARIVAAVKQAVGDRIPVGIRLSQIKVSDPDYRWSGEDEAAAIFGAVTRAGADFVHISDFDALRPAFGDHGPSLAALAKLYLEVPVIAAGGLHEPDKAARMVFAADTDAVAIARGALADPQWPARVRAGEPPVAFTPELFSNGPTIAGVDAWRAGQPA